MGRFIDLPAGARFGRWTVVGLMNIPKEALWRVVCECGKPGVVAGYALRSGASLSCGCLTLEINSARRKHGLAKSPEYSSWSAAKQRCTNPNHIEYHRYGAQGISMCDRWLNDFAAFYADMGPKPSARHSIDRIDGTKGYEPGNCRWATPLEQTRNRRPPQKLRKAA